MAKAQGLFAQELDLCRREMRDRLINTIISAVAGCPLHCPGRVPELRLLTSDWLKLSCQTVETVFAARYNDVASINKHTVRTTELLRP